MDWLFDYSYVGIIVFLILTGCGLPVPEEAAIVAAGIFAAEGSLNVGLAYGACIVGALLGDSVMYLIGHHFGRRLLHGGSMWGRLLPPEREKLLEAKINQHGLKVFLVARFLVGIRGPVYLTAGILKVPFRRFIIIDAISATVVITIFFGLSYYLGKPVLGWIKQAETGITIIVGVGIVVAAVLVWFNRRRLGALAKAALQHVPHPEVLDEVVEVKEIIDSPSELHRTSIAGTTSEQELRSRDGRPLGENQHPEGKLAGREESETARENAL